MRDRHFSLPPSFSPSLPPSLLLLSFHFSLPLSLLPSVIPSLSSFLHPFLCWTVFSADYSFSLPPSLPPSFLPLLSSLQHPLLRRWSVLAAARYWARPFRGDAVLSVRLLLLITLLPSGYLLLMECWAVSFLLLAH